MSYLDQSALKRFGGSILNVRSESALQRRRASAFSHSCLVVHLITILVLCTVNAVDSSAYGHWIVKLLENDLKTSTPTLGY